MLFKKLILTVGVCSLSFTNAFAEGCGSATQEISACSDITSQSSCSNYYINECFAWTQTPGAVKTCAQYVNVQCKWGTGADASCYNGGQQCMISA